MGYKKNIWYLIGVALFVLAALDMAVTMVFMYYGNDMAIVWFFAACPVMIVGWFIMQAIKQRYDDACLDDEPAPLFWRTRYIWKVLLVVVAHKGLGKVIFVSVTGLVAAATLTFGVLWCYNVYGRNSVKSDPEFVQNTAVYDEYYARWTEARVNGDDELAHEYFKVLEETNGKNYVYRQRIKTYGENAKIYGSVALACLSATGLMATVYITYLRRRRKQET